MLYHRPNKLRGPNTNKNTFDIGTYNVSFLVWGESSKIYKKDIFDITDHCPNNSIIPECDPSNGALNPAFLVMKVHVLGCPTDVSRAPQRC